MPMDDVDRAALAAARAQGILPGVPVMVDGRQLIEVILQGKPGLDGVQMGHFLDAANRLYGGSNVTIWCRADTQVWLPVLTIALTRLAGYGGSFVVTHRMRSTVPPGNLLDDDLVAAARLANAGSVVHPIARKVVQGGPRA